MQGRRDVVIVRNNGSDGAVGTGVVVAVLGTAAVTRMGK